MWPNPLTDARWTIAKRDIASLSQEKTIVLALIIQLFIAAFSSFLVVGLTSLYDPGATEGQQIAVGIGGGVQEELEAVAEEVDDVVVENYGTHANAMEAFENGEVHAVVSGNTVPTEDGSIIEIRAVAPEEDLRTTVIVVSLREYLTELESAERIDRLGDLEFQPIDVPEEEGGSPHFGFTYTILLPLLLFLPAFISGSIAVDSLTEELERGTLELLRATPVSLVDIVDGKAIGMIALAPLQALLWILLLRFNGIGIDHVAWLLLFVTAIATILVVLGLVLGLVTRVRRQAQLLYSMIALLLFGFTIVLPEHPASTVAKLAVDSALPMTFAHVVSFTVFAIGIYWVVRLYVQGLNPESL